MFSITKTITQKQNIGIPELQISGSEGNRTATVWLPVTGENGELLDPLMAFFGKEDFNTFYSEYTNDKYLVDVVLEKHGIELDTSNIQDITN